MERLIDAAAVLLFAGAVAFVGAHQRGFPKGAPAGDEASVTTDVGEPFAGRVARVLPRLERYVAAGSMRERGLVCDEREQLADIATMEEQIGDGREDPTTAAALASGIRALRECVACTPEPHGCADAARAFSEVEERLSLDRPAGGI